MGDRVLIEKSRWMLLLSAFLLTACANTSHLNGWTRVELSGKRLTSSDFEHTRPPRSANGAAYSFLPHGALARIPFDGSMPEKIRLPANTYGLSVDKHGNIWVMSYEPLSHNVFLMTAPKLNKRSGADWIWRVSPPLHLTTGVDFRNSDWPVQVVAGSNAVFVLTEKQIAKFNIAQGRWYSKALKNAPDIIYFDNPSALVQNDRWIQEAREARGQVLRFAFDSCWSLGIDRGLSQRESGSASDHRNPGSGLAFCL